GGLPARGEEMPTCNSWQTIPMHQRAGLQADPSDLVDVARLLRAFFEVVPDAANPTQRVVFGTSGHRGSSLNGSFNEAHIAAISMAIAEYRAAQGIAGPLFLGGDTHALSAPAIDVAARVLAAAGVHVLLPAAGTARNRMNPARAEAGLAAFDDAGFDPAMYVPTPALSRAI